MSTGVAGYHRGLKDLQFVAFKKRTEFLCAMLVNVDGKSVTFGRVIYIREEMWEGVYNGGRDKGKKGDPKKEYILLHLSCSLCWGTSF